LVFKETVQRFVKVLFGYFEVLGLDLVVKIQNEEFLVLLGEVVSPAAFFLDLEVLLIS
jgi:hypothetical protein